MMQWSWTTIHFKLLLPESQQARACFNMKIHLKQSEIEISQNIDYPIGILHRAWQWHIGNKHIVWMNRSLQDIDFRWIFCFFTLQHAPGQTRNCRSVIYWDNPTWQIGLAVGKSWSQRDIAQNQQPSTHRCKWCATEVWSWYSKPN